MWLKRRERKNDEMNEKKKDVKKKRKKEDKGSSSSSASSEKKMWLKNDEMMKWMKRKKTLKKKTRKKRRIKAHHPPPPPQDHLRNYEAGLDISRIFTVLSLNLDSPTVWCLIVLGSRWALQNWTLKGKVCSMSTFYFSLPKCKMATIKKKYKTTFVTLLRSL